MTHTYVFYVHLLIVYIIQYKIYEFFFYPNWAKYGVSFFIPFISGVNKVYTYTYLTMQKLLKYRFIWQSY